MTLSPAPAVVAGYDGSPTAKAALLFAAGQAALRGRALRIVYARETSVALPQPSAVGLTREALWLVQRSSPGLRLGIGCAQAPPLAS
ncbi:universal stress protein [Sporichthya sp.]|uniref:universal stress protein n=1 Tax=Sporichthya sp. TaxID=65475 RepID=UPI0025E39612|nr:universal stress protein [Sporichthya sp.]